MEKYGVVTDPKTPEEVKKKDTKAKVDPNANVPKTDAEGTEPFETRKDDGKKE